MPFHECVAPESMESAEIVTEAVGGVEIAVGTHNTCVLDPGSRSPHSSARLGASTTMRGLTADITANNPNSELINDTV